MSGRGTDGPEVRLVCFDLGGVLVRICRSWAEGCAAAGLPLRDGTDREHVRALRRRLSDLHHRGALAGPAFFEQLAAAMEGAYTPDEIARIHRAWVIGPYDGVEAIVERLAATPGVETGVLSNTNDAHWAHMEDPDGAFAFLRRIRHRHASHLLGLAKPEPDIYREFERRTGVPGRHILFFDDLEENVEGAKSVGWRAERIDHASCTATQIAQHLARYGLWGEA